jgi:hypothetical protein
MCVWEILFQFLCVLELQYHHRFHSYQAFRYNRLIDFNVANRRCGLGSFDLMVLARWCLTLVCRPWPQNIPSWRSSGQVRHSRILDWRSPGRVRQNFPHYFFAKAMLHFFFLQFTHLRQCRLLVTISRPFCVQLWIWSLRPKQEAIWLWQVRILRESSVLNHLSVKYSSFWVM